ncbi:degV domain-containing protein [Deinococcus arenae]|uniref:DegV domain-containing protein n=2 Tax=Deinococcus TaxID=1298 RepID=A0A8H9L4D3_9DEIO|nr:MULTISPECIES: DegV family protein [Deinococcus]ALW88873.1 fatty acid-binding protein DegV [Deinococcus actinosclerus]AWT35630.1 DegV family protein [Deinococcus actinosclerus]GGM33167.1 degV domain-containing protein [Deinococcus arenae]
MTIAIVTDSTSDLTPELLAQIGVTRVPLYVLFDGKMHKDGLEITPQDIFAGLKAGKKTPSTSQPSPAEFAAAYTQALQSADEVLSIHISGQMSGTVGSARLAAQEFGGKVTVVDSRSVSMGLGLRVLRAAELAHQGLSMNEIVRQLEAAGAKADIRFTVDTLDFLRINGRIGGAQALLGSLLNIKPILIVKDGRVESGGRVRGHKKAMADIVEHVRKYVAQHGSARVAVMCTPGGEEYVQEVRAGLAGLNFEDMGDHQIGAVVATHAGPGTVGVTLEPVTV